MTYDEREDMKKGELLSKAVSLIVLVAVGLYYMCVDFIKDFFGEHLKSYVWITIIITFVGSILYSIMGVLFGQKDVVLLFVVNIFGVGMVTFVLRYWMMKKWGMLK